MKVIILAGGTGTRLGSITQYIPKPMVRVGGRPLLWHIMKRYATYGHKDFVVALGYRGDVIKEFFMNYDSHSQDFTINLGNNNVEFHNSSHTRLDWNVTLVDTGDNTLKGSRIKQLESFIEGTTMMTYGDGVSDVNLDELEKFHRSHGKCVTLTGVHPPSRFGEIKLKNNNLIGFEEKPQTSSGLINGGYMSSSILTNPTSDWVEPSARNQTISDVDV